MAKRDKFGPLLQAYIEAADRPVTALEMQEGVGCSRQRVYQWLKDGARNVRTLTRQEGVGENGAKLYAYQPTRVRVGHVAIDLGATLIVTGIRLSETGERVYDVSTDDGGQVALSGANGRPDKGATR